MMHYRSHQAKWQYIPMAAPRPSRWQRFLAALKDLYRPAPAPEGRRAIDPAMPYGHWAAGWTGACPGQKKSR